MNLSFANSPSWKNQSFNHSFNTSAMLNTSNYNFRQSQARDNFIMSIKALYCLEPFGAPLPSMVKSLLNQATDGQKISCRVDPNGWAWLVSGRKLYIWRHSFSHESKRSNIIACRELCLPTSELAHQAALVCIVTSSSSVSSVPACIAVSPEGQITYWPNISNDSGTITISADIPGQECESLSSLWPHACILTTTTSTVLLVKPILASGNKPSLSCVPLVLYKGWLGGLSRKVTSMLFNPIPASAGNETKRAKVAVPISKGDLSQPGVSNPLVYILHGSIIQIWTMGPDLQLNQTNSINIEDMARKFFLENPWISGPPADSGSPYQVKRIQVWLLDIDILPNQNIAVLAAAYDTTEAHPLIHYGIITLNCKDPGNKEESTFVLVNYTTPYTPYEDEQRTSKLQSWKILGVSNFICMLNPETLVIVSGGTEVDTVDATANGGKFLGYSRVSEGTIVVFAPKMGIMSLKGTTIDNLLDESYTDFVRVPDNLAAEITQHNFDDLPLSDDNVNRLKTAFLAFIAKKTSECQEIINSLFSNNSQWSPEESIDLITLALCDKLIDDSPSSDHRGVTSYASSAEPDHMGFKSKQLILKNLANKKDVVELYLGFLNNVGILQQLTRVVLKEDTIATGSILYNSYEKIGFALAIHQFQSEPQYRNVIEPAIKLIVKSRSQKETQVRSSHLGTNEQFYKDVSRIHQIIKGLVLLEEEQLSTALPQEMPDIVHTVNEIILKSLCDMSMEYLSDKLPAIKASLITPLMESQHNEYEVLNWVVESRVLTYLLKQHQFIVTHGLNVTEDAGIQASLLKDLSQLTDIILDGLQQNLASLRNSDRYNQRLKQFNELRYTLLKEFVEVKDFDGAIAMAEKYVDFEIIVNTCYTTGDYEMFDHYFEKYADLNFPEFTFEWFVKQKKQDELVANFTKSNACSRLAVFLEGYPEMSWHFKSIMEDYKGASETLNILANGEDTSTADRKFYLRLSKLALLSSGVQAEDIDGNSFYDDCESEVDEGDDDLEKLSVLSLYEEGGGGDEHLREYERYEDVLP